MSFKIITDTASNMTTKASKHYDIQVIPLTFIVDDKEYQLIDTDDFDYDNYYKEIGEGKKVNTSQVTPQQYMDVFEEVLKNGDDILFVALSSGVSGTFNSAKFAAEEMMEMYPERKIRVVDSLGASLGEGLLAVEAAELRDAGKTLDEVADYLDFEKYKMAQIFAVDDLKHLRRTGRISGAVAMVGSVLSIKPILKGDTQGKIVSECNARGRKQAIKALAEKYQELVDKPEEQMIGISYGGCREDAVHLANLISKIAEPKKIWMVPHEPATGSHVGPAMLGLYFKGKDDVRAF